MCSPLLLCRTCARPCRPHHLLYFKARRKDHHLCFLNQMCSRWVNNDGCRGQSPARQGLHQISCSPCFPSSLLQPHPVRERYLHYRRKSGGKWLPQITQLVKWRSLVGGCWPVTTLLSATQLRSGVLLIVLLELPDRAQFNSGKFEESSQPLPVGWLAKCIVRAAESGRP